MDNVKWQHHNIVCARAVHLRIREVDQLIPKSLYPTTSGNTYWQIEAESSILNCQYTFRYVFYSISAVFDVKF